MIGPHILPCETPAAHSAKGDVERSTRFVLPATILGSSMGFIDASVVNVALPAMERSLGASLGTLQWVMNGYLLTLASLILLGGSAGDRYGRRRYSSPAWSGSWLHRSRAGSRRMPPGSSARDSRKAPRPRC